MDTIPESNSISWIDRNYKQMGNKSSIEFIFGKPIKKQDFKLALNYSSSCWKSMVNDVDDIVLAIKPKHSAAGNINLYSRYLCEYVVCDLEHSHNFFRENYQPNTHIESATATYCNTCVITLHLSKAKKKQSKNMLL